MNRIRVLQVLIFTYLLAVALSDFSQLSYWAVILVFPIVTLVLTHKKKYLIPDTLKHMFLTFGAFILLILITGLLSADFYRPLRSFLLILSTFIVSFVSVIQIVNVGILRRYLLAIILFSVFYSLILFINQYSGGLQFTFNHQIEGEGGWLGKNSSAPILFIGFCCVVLNLAMFKSSTISIVLAIFLFISILMTGAIKVIIPAIIIFLVSIRYYTKRKNIWVLIYLLIIIGGGVAFLQSYEKLLLSNEEFRIVTSRAFLFLGLEDLAYYNHLNVSGFRESLISQGIRIFLNNPFIGIGLENTRDLLGTYTHNTYLEIAAGGGIFLLSSFLLFLWYCLKSIIKCQDPSLRRLQLIIFASIIFISLGQRIYDNRVILLFLFFLPLLNYFTRHMYEKK